MKKQNKILNIATSICQGMVIIVITSALIGIFGALVVRVVRWILLGY